MPSQCGIKSLNEYQDNLSGRRKETKEAKVENEDDISKVWAGAEASDHKNGHYSSEAYAGLAAFEIDDNQSLVEAEAKASAEVGLGGAIAEAEADVKIYNYDGEEVDIEVGKAYAEGGLGIGPGGVKAKMEAGVDVVNAEIKLGEDQEITANLGVSVDTGIEAGVNGFGVSLLGFGAYVGRNTGFSTPIGSFNIKLW